MGFSDCLALVKEEPFVELRFDLLDLTPDQVTEVVQAAKKSIATYRPGTADPDRRMQTMIRAIIAGATFVDIELDSDSYYRKELMKSAREHGREVIISYHNFDRTPGASILRDIAADCKKAGADVVKIACRVKGTRDVRALMGLYTLDERMVVVGMGDKGLITRVAAPFVGAEFTFAAPEAGRETAPGQIDRQSLVRLIDLIKYSFVREQYNK
jgi:3-dehydroquinate dehydratase type I